MSDGRAAPEEFLERIRAEKQLSKSMKEGSLKYFWAMLQVQGKLTPCWKWHMF